MQPIRIGINGLGRIGRLVLHHAYARAVHPGNPGQVRAQRPIQVVAANDIGAIDVIAYLLSYDSVHRFREVKAEVGDGRLRLGPLDIRVHHQPEPAQIPWGDDGVDLVLECSGRFTKRAQLEQHFTSGPKRIILGAPGEADRTVCIGVNEDAIDRERDRVLSCASCTTNAIAAPLSVMDKVFGVQWGLVGTVHAYTADQALVDGPKGKELRRGRAAAANIVPSSTGAARAISAVLPNLAGKLDGSAVRVPVPNGSLYDITCTLKGSPSIDRVIEAMRDAASTERLRGILDVRDEQLVSSDIIGDTHSSIVDVGASMGLGPLVRVVGWYDNEFAYAARLLDLASSILS